jgi:hypothetical protein
MALSALKAQGLAARTQTHPAVWFLTDPSESMLKD